MGADPGVTVRAVRGLTLWLLGYPDRGRDSLQEALAQAREIEQPSSSAFAHLWAGATYALLGRDEATALMHSEALRSLGEAGVIYGVWAELLAGQGSATGPEPRLKQGSAQTAEAASAMQALSSGVGYPSLLLVQAHVYARAGQAEMGLASVDQALAWVERTGVRVMEAEVWRMRGELLLAANRPWTMDDRQPAPTLASRPPSSGEVEACFHHALEIARGQEARWLELRTVVSLARLWRSEGRRNEARELLTGIYGWFAEGTDTVDLVEARVLLDELE